jgi:TetR/AcrR family transcriptional repressor of nem operon
MTDLSTRPGKRDRLIWSAAELFHAQGVQRTTIAQVAERADVPPGNVYYYFKSFEELVDAVIAHHMGIVRDNLQRLNSRRSPKARLKGLADLWSMSASVVADNGCPLGSLSSELNKLHDLKTPHVAQLLGEVLDFVERQLRELGRRDARALAVTMLSRIQGAALLANTFSDAKLMRDEVRRIDRWIDELS